MPAWVLYSLLGTAIYVVVCFVDKYNLERHIKNYRGMVIYSALVCLVMGTILWMFSGFSLLNFKDGLLVILTGILTVFAASIYFYVVQKEQASKVIFMYQLIPVFVLILAVIFLKETINFKQIIGSILVLIPSLLIASGSGNKLKFSFDKNIALLLVIDLLNAVSLVLFKFVVEAGSFLKVVAYESWGWAIGGLILFILFPSVRNAFFETNKSIKKRVLLVILGNEIFYVGSKFFIFLAVSLGSVYLVNVITGTQVIFGAILGVILTILAPHIFKENIEKADLFKKIILGAVTLIGLGFIY